MNLKIRNEVVRSKSKTLAILLILAIFVGLPTRTAADSIEGTPIIVGVRPSFIAFDNAGVSAYIVNDGISVSKVDLGSNTVVGTLNSLGAKQLVIDASDNYAYLTNNEQKKITKIDLTTFTQVGQITISGSNIQPWGIALNNAGTSAYVIDANSSNFYTVDIGSFSLTHTENLGSLSIPTTVKLGRTNQFAYVGSSNKVMKVNLSSYAFERVIDASYLSDFYLNNDETKIFYSGGAPGGLRKVDIASGSVEATLVDTGGSFAVDSSESFAYFGGLRGMVRVNLRTMTASTPVSFSSSSHYLTTYLELNETQDKIYALAHAYNGVSNGVLVQFALSNSPDPQTISFDQLTSKLSSALPFSLSATSSSGLAVTFTSSTPSICSVNSRTVTVIKVGECTINADQAGGSGWAQAVRVTQTFVVLPAPPSGEPGVSINSGSIYTNSKSVKLNLVWPEYATEARVSNDGGFLSSMTTTIQLASAVDWNLEDSLSGKYEKTVYVRFSGSGIDTTKTYSDDIVLDTSAPVVDSVSASASSGTVEVSLKVTDDITGPDKVEIKNGNFNISMKYSPVISFTEKEIGLSVTSSGMRKFDSSKIEIRVSDKAGNLSAYQLVSVVRPASSAIATPVLTATKSLAAKSIASFAKLKISSSSKISLKVLQPSRKYCKVVGSTLKGVKAGACKVTVTVTPKKGRAISRTVALKVQR